jgi:isovaleryl-CoA dehydrogenase
VVRTKLTQQASVRSVGGSVSVGSTGSCGWRSFSSHAQPRDTAAERDLIFNPTPEHKSLREMVRAFAEAELDPQALKYDREERFNVDMFRRLGPLGLLGITVDPKYGGSGMDATAAIIVAEELNAADPSMTLSYLAHALLFAHNLDRNGTEEQKQRFLPGACDGSKIGGMCMTEPGAGTDVLGMQTRAEASADGSYFTLNGTKMFITNGTIDNTDTGDMFLVYAKTSTGRGMGDLSTFIVEKGMPGFKLGMKVTDKCGCRGSNTAELVFEDVKVILRHHDSP